MTTPVRTRFAPSPTGFIHLGNIRSALYPWAFARKSKGVFVLRIEDTDVERSTEQSVDAILEGMQWLGLDYDEGPFYQMQRMDRYREVLKEMQEQGLVYPCYMSTEELDALRERQRAAGEKPRYDGTWRPEPGKVLPTPPEGVQPVLRFRNPLTGVVAWDDAVKGRVEISNEELDDLVIARPDGTPTYNFCVVVDDLDMKITHVIRGDDHVNNTPRQINILRALGAEPPVYAHLPTVLNEQGEKMSKRHGAMSVMGYRDAGYLPEAVLNYLARLGWSHGDQEIFTTDEMVAAFDLAHIGRSPARFDFAKLENLNGHYIRNTADADLVAALESVLPHIAGGDELARNLTPRLRTQLASAMPGLKERAKTLVELFEASRFIWADRPLAINEQAKALLNPDAKATLAGLLVDLENLKVWEPNDIETAVRGYAERAGLKLGSVAQPLRASLTGKTTSPPIFDVLMVLGRDESLARVRDQVA